MKDNILEILRSMVPKINKLAKVFVDVIYKYDVDAQVLNDIIANNNDNKVIFNK